MADSFKIIDDRKYMWDGEEYQSESDAQKIVSKYRSDGFDARLIEENSKYLVYTRRVAANVIADNKDK